MTKRKMTYLPPLSRNEQITILPNIKYEEGGLKMTEEIKTSFYYCYVPGKSAPIVKHATLNEAEQEATRIAVREKSDVQILKCVGVTKLTPLINYLPENDNQKTSNDVLNYDKEFFTNERAWVVLDDGTITIGVIRKWGAKRFLVEHEHNGALVKSMLLRTHVFKNLDDAKAFKAKYAGDLWM